MFCFVFLAHFAAADPHRRLRYLYRLLLNLAVSSVSLFQKELSIVV